MSMAWNIWIVSSTPEVLICVKMKTHLECGIGALEKYKAYLLESKTHFTAFLLKKSLSFLIG